MNEALLERVKAGVTANRNANTSNPYSSKEVQVAIFSIANYKALDTMKFMLFLY